MSEPVSVVETPVRLAYTYTPGVAASRFLREVQRGRLVGQRCPRCGKVYLPPRGSCSMCGELTTDEVELPGTGTVASFAVTRIPSPSLQAPYVTAWVLLDGADITSMFLIDECDPDDVHQGMRVEPVWVDAAEREPNLGSIRHLRPSGEPDAAYETYRDYV